MLSVDPYQCNDVKQTDQWIHQDMIICHSRSNGEGEKGGERGRERGRKGEEVGGRERGDKRRDKERGSETR